MGSTSVMNCKPVGFLFTAEAAPGHDGSLSVLCSGGGERDAFPGHYHSSSIWYYYYHIIYWYCYILSWWNCSDFFLSPDQRTTHIINSRSVFAVLLFLRKMKLGKGMVKRMYPKWTYTISLQLFVVREHLPWSVLPKQKLLQKQGTHRSNSTS